MNARKFAVGSAVIALAGFVGCMNEEPSAPALDEPVSNVEQNVQDWRNDQSDLKTPGLGFWGGWMPRKYCNAGSWAIAYRMRVESYRGGGVIGNNDDTALNAVQLFCQNPSTGTGEWISPYNGLWGNWYSSATCPGSGNYLKGARMWIEPSQGGGDDTAANDVEFSCTQGGTIHAPGGQGWGTPGSLEECPSGSAVCGLEIRFEDSQGGGDDTALNGLKLMCCNLSVCSSSCFNDGYCNPACENSWTCSVDCGPPCGDRVCSPGESAGACPADCSVCPDGMCTGDEDQWSCPSDCSCGSGPEPQCPLR